MCLPMRRTWAMRACSSVAAISAGRDFRVCALQPSQTDSMTSPATRLCKTRAMVSTSGSSGIGAVYRALGIGNWELGIGLHKLHKVTSTSSYLFFYFLTFPLCLCVSVVSPFNGEPGLQNATSDQPSAALLTPDDWRLTTLQWYAYLYTPRSAQSQPFFQTAKTRGRSACVRTPGSEYFCYGAGCEKG